MTASTKLHAVVDRAMTPDEISLLAAFREMDSSTRNDALCAVQSMASFRPRRRPALTLVRSSQRQRPEGA